MSVTNNSAPSYIHTGRCRFRHDDGGGDALPAVEPAAAFVGPLLHSTVAGVRAETADGVGAAEPVEAALDELWAAEVCDGSLAARLAAAKDRFSQVDGQAFRRARQATNPYESLGAGPFVCRSVAAKIDRLAKMFVDDQRQERALSEDDSTRRAVARWGGPLDGAVVFLRAGPGRLGTVKCP